MTAEQWQCHMVKGVLAAQAAAPQTEPAVPQTEVAAPRTDIAELQTQF